MSFSDSFILQVVVIYTMKADIETLKTNFQLKFDIDVDPSVTVQQVAVTRPVHP